MIKQICCFFSRQRKPMDSLRKHRHVTYGEKTLEERRSRYQLKAKRLTKMLKQSSQKKIAYELDRNRIIIQFGIPATGIVLSFFNPIFIEPTAMWIYLIQINETIYTKKYLEERLNKRMSQYLIYLTYFMALPPFVLLFFRQSLLSFFPFLLISQAYSVVIMYYEFTQLKDRIPDLFKKISTRCIHYFFTLALFFMLEHLNTENPILEQQIRLDKNP